MKDGISSDPPISKQHFPQNSQKYHEINAMNFPVYSGAGPVLTGCCQAGECEAELMASDARLMFSSGPNCVSSK